MRIKMRKLICEEREAEPDTTHSGGRRWLPASQNGKSLRTAWRKRNRPYQDGYEDGSAYDPPNGLDLVPLPASGGDRAELRKTQSPGSQAFTDQVPPTSFKAHPHSFKVPPTASRPHPFLGVLEPSQTPHSLGPAHIDPKPGLCKFPWLPAYVPQSSAHLPGPAPDPATHCAFSYRYLTITQGMTKSAGAPVQTPPPAPHPAAAVSARRARQAHDPRDSSAGLGRQKPGEEGDPLR